MCNLYNISTTHEMMRQFAGAVDDLTNRLDPSEDIYPDRPAPVIRNKDGNRELAMLTWGCRPHHSSPRANPTQASRTSAMWPVPIGGAG
jgi:putative SOS response-associated peptidase YedK